MTNPVMRDAQTIVNLLKNDLAWIDQQIDPECRRNDSRACDRHPTTYALHMTNIYAEEVVVDIWDSETVGVAHALFFTPHTIGVAK